MREGGRTGNPDSCLPSHALLQITAPLVPGPPATRRLELSVFALDHHPQSGMNRSRGVSRGPHSNQLWVSPNQPCDPWAASPQPPLSAPRMLACGVVIRFPGVPSLVLTFPQQTTPPSTHKTCGRQGSSWLLHYYQPFFIISHPQDNILI